MINIYFFLTVMFNFNLKFQPIKEYIKTRGPLIFVLSTEQTIQRLSAHIE